jgi:uncharacterized membrane protein
MMSLIVVGILFRGVNLDQRTYWVDEVATSIRIAGYTRTEVTQRLATGTVHTAADLLHYQQLNSDRTWSDVIQALTQSPEHAPLYFLLARMWVQLWGDSVTAIRSLSVLLSVLALPCMAWFCWQLFQSQAVPWIGTGLFAISPFFVAYAQEARPYSLWSLTLLLVGGSLVNALRHPSRMAWSRYALSLAIALYTSLLTGFVVIGTSLYMLLVGTRRPSKWASLQAFSWATGIGLLAFAPWLVVVARRWVTLQDNTAWMHDPLPLWMMLAVGFYSIAVLFLDVPVSVDASLNTGVKGAIAFGILAVVVYAFCSLSVKAPRIGLLLLAFSAATPVALVALDLMRGGQASATPRYWIPCQLGVLIAVAHWLGDRPCSSVEDLGSEYRRSNALQQSSKRHRVLSRGQIQQLIAGLLIVISLLSCLLNLNRTPAYQKARNQANEAIATQINQAATPLLISEADHTMDVLSLSRSLHPDTAIRILPLSGWDGRLTAAVSQFVLQPSSMLQQQIERDRTLALKRVYQPDLLTALDVHLALWQIVPRDS